MADVFDVLKADHDEVKGILEQLEGGPSLASGATGEQLAVRKRLADELTMNEIRHEAAEQQHFWPALRALGPEGDRVADQALEQETAGEEVMDKLSSLKPEDHQFESVLAELISDARAHIAFEEAHAWPLLSISITAQQSDDLAQKITQAKKVAPTRPHPNVPPQPGAQKAAGPVAAAADKLRDTLTGRGKRS
ncbi:MAG: hemerythrin domain-containing protein [Streptosporangiales bacterium]|nr:hemerythrin domain-containing protein [Streptosporangiales bacterium]